MSKLRKVDDLKGRHKLAELGFDGFADAIQLAFPRYQHLAKAGSALTRNDPGGLIWVSTG
jgi:hypothetical protein